MPPRDYILRMIEQIGEMIQRITTGRANGQTQNSLHSVYSGMELLFGLDMKAISSLSTEELFQQLTAEENVEYASEKCFAFAALSYQAGLSYMEMAKAEQGSSAFNLALLFTLRASSMVDRPCVLTYAPKIEDLVHRLEGSDIWPQGRKLLDDHLRSGGGKSTHPVRA